MTCEVCAAVAPRRGPLNRYCEPCSDAKDRERKRLWMRAHAKPQSEHQKAQVAQRRAARRAAAVENGDPKVSLEWMASTPSPTLAWRVAVAVPFSYGMSKNAIWRNVTASHVVLRRDARQRRNHICMLLRAAIAQSGHRVARNKLWLDIFVEKSDNRGDAVNFIDLVCDAVKDATELDDRWYSIRRVDWSVQKSDPRLLVGIGQDSTVDSEICSYCGGLKPLDEFGKKKGNPTGRDRVCKLCSRTPRPAR